MSDSDCGGGGDFGGGWSGGDTSGGSCGVDNSASTTPGGDFGGGWGGLFGGGSDNTAPAPTHTHHAADTATQSANTDTFIYIDNTQYGPTNSGRSTGSSFRSSGGSFGGASARTSRSSAPTPSTPAQPFAQRPTGRFLKAAAKLTAYGVGAAAVGTQVWNSVSYGTADLERAVTAAGNMHYLTAGIDEVGAVGAAAVGAYFGVKALRNRLRTPTVATAAKPTPGAR